MLLSGVTNIITSMLIQVHATARLISGLVQIAKQTPEGIQSDNTQIDHARRINEIPKALVTRTTQEQYSLTSETSWFEPHPPHIFTRIYHETRVPGPIARHSILLLGDLIWNWRFPRSTGRISTRRALKGMAEPSPFERDRTHKGASHALFELKKRIMKELRYNGRNSKKTNSLARTPRAKWAVRQKSLVRSHPKVLVVPYWVWKSTHWGMAGCWQGPWIQRTCIGCCHGVNTQYVVFVKAAQKKDCQKITRHRGCFGLQNCIPNRKLSVLLLWCAANRRIGPIEEILSIQTCMCK